MQTKDRSISFRSLGKAQNESSLIAVVVMQTCFFVWSMGSESVFHGFRYAFR
eukprot:m.18205 g.18205  ORF g.18205 m.18205 type:complete len:52 (-) comp11884_c0_seq1:90-245(-)